MTAPTDRWASGSAYDAYIGRWSRLVATGFLDWLAVPPGARWLDVGCGTGALTAAILARCDPLSVVGVDPSSPFVEHARVAVADRRASFAVGSAAETGLPPASVDVVVSGLVLNFVPDLATALGESSRVAAPGGIVAGYVWDYREGMELLRRFWDAAVALDAGAATLDEGVRFPTASAEGLRDAFRAAGLDDVETCAIDVPTAFSGFDEVWTPFLSGTGPAPSYVASLAAVARDALRDRFRASLAEREDGTIRLSARAWAVRGRTGR